MVEYWEECDADHYGQCARHTSESPCGGWDASDG